MKSLAVGALLVLLAFPAAGVEPYLVKDIDPVPAPAGSDPAHPVAFQGAVLFFASDGLAGRELWRSDGTAGGTFPLSEGSGLGSPRPYLVTEHLYFFVSANPIGDYPGLWVSDGTVAGTFRLTEPGVAVDGRPRVWIASQGFLYFPGRDAEHGTELWRTDGTPAGTRLVADIRPGPESSNIAGMAEYKGRVWFGADDGQRGGSLWRSDGTEDGTVLAVDPFPASAGNASPEFVQAAGGRITFFTEPPGLELSLVKQLWGGDGTAGGTSLISSAKILYDHIVRGNRLYFIAESRKGQELWVSDGTKPGTRPLTNFPKLRAFEVFSSFLPQGFGDGRFLFWADDGTHGAEPWITDGTPGGTRLLKDLCPGLCPTFGSTWLTFRGRLYFTTQSTGGYELWATNGTRAGTRLVSGACPKSCLFDLNSPFVVGDRLVFVGRDAENGQELWSTQGKEMVRITDFEERFLWEEDGFQGAVLNGQLLFGGQDDLDGMELWRTDGTAARTGLVADINRTDAGGSYPGSLRALGDEVVFAVNPEEGAPELWKSDGTAAGTVRFRILGPDEPDGAYAQGETAEVGGVLFYTSYGVPWRTDGTEAGTFRLTGPVLPACCVEPEMQAVGSTVFFQLWDEEHGDELWATDGTREGTRLVRDILPGADGSFPMNLTAFQGKLWFAAYTDFPGVELWTSDGTAAGTVLFMDVHLGGVSSAPTHLTVHAGRLWFFANDAEHGNELWSSDGTVAGTRLEAELLPGPSSLGVQFMVSLGDRLVFSAFGSGLWVSDGAPAGTRKIQEHGLDPLNPSIPRTVFQGRLYYRSGGVLWVSDGTEAGTLPLVDQIGAPILAPERFAVLGDRLVFTVRTFLGLKLWESDGTPEGTFEIGPPLLLVYPSELVGAGDRVFFPAEDGSTGTELWAVRP